MGADDQWIGHPLHPLLTDLPIGVWTGAFVLDFGGKEVHGENHVYAGLINLERNPSVTKVASVGEASLWRITACG